MPRLHGFWYIRINCFSTKAPGKKPCLLPVKQNEQQAGQAQQEGIEQQGDDALKDAGEGDQQGGGALGADAVSCQHSAGNQVHPLNSSLVFSYPTTRTAKSSPVLSTRGPIGFLADSEEEQHNYQNAGEGAITTEHKTRNRKGNVLCENCC